jgi:sugar lactone lactonase YvrE
MSDAVPIRAVSEPCLLGESPMWHPEEGLLYWCDIDAHALYRLDPLSGASRRWDLPCEVSACAPLLGGGLLLAMRDGLWRFDVHSARRFRIAPAPYDSSRQRFNDGKCDPQGRFWIGSIDEPRRPEAALYRWDGRELTRQAGGITTSNGLAWSPDGRTLYWSDTRAHTIYAFDFDPAAGSLSSQRVFCRFEPRQAMEPLSAYGGRPDGAAMDSEGCYWVAMYEGQRLLRLSPTAQVLADIKLPVRCPTMPCFGDSDLRSIYLTSARHGRPADELAEQPWAGAVLRLRVEVAGLPTAFAIP